MAATRGYPKTRFEIIDHTQIPELPVEYTYDTTAITMAAFTSDKGPENWQMIRDLTTFTNKYGGLNFERHGQTQIMIAEILRRGGYVFGKRLVSSNATLANVTIHARIVESDGISYLYTYATSEANCGNIYDAADAGHGDYSFDNTEALDFPLFTITAQGRGDCRLFFRLNPEYSSSKSSSCIRYSLEIYEDQTLLETVVCSLNPSYTVDDIAQNIQAKVSSRSSQISCYMFEDGIYGLVRKLAESAELADSSMTVDELINHDFINGRVRRGNSSIGNIITAPASDDSTDEWVGNMPADINTIYRLDSANGIPLVNGSSGELGDNPMNNPDELTKLLLGAWGKDQDSEQFDPIIYDLDTIKPDAVFDAAYPLVVKNAIIDVCDFRGDMMFFADCGMDLSTLNSIVDYASDINRSRYCAIYHNHFDVISPYTNKSIHVTMPYLLAQRFVKHMDNGVGRPFAGIANGFTFPEIINGTLNFQPIVIPGLDQKQVLADNCINYLNYYDGVAVLETMYVTYEEYTQLSFLHNILSIQQVIKAIRSHCPKVRYTFLDGDDLENYIEDARTVLNYFQSNFKSIDIEYMADEVYELNNIFYATITVRFHNFIQEEFFKIYAIN